MKPTNADFFVDSNIFLYLFGDDIVKRDIAKSLLNSNPIISTQVISENINVLLKKFQSVTQDDVREHINNLMTAAKRVELITEHIILKAIDIRSQLNYQWYDSLIITSALLSNCSILYSEDLHHNQPIENKLTIINPFL